MKNKINNSKSKELFYDTISNVWAFKINNSETNKRIKVIFSDLLSKRELKGKKFLEVGCGLGYFSNIAFKSGAMVTGIDIGPNLVKINKKLTPKGTFKVASASNLPFKDNSFDIVLSTEVIEHVANQKKALSEMSRVVKKGGILVLTTPNKMYKPLFDLLSLMNIRPYHGIENWFYKGEIEHFMISKKMKIINNFYFNFFINYAFKFIKI